MNREEANYYLKSSGFSDEQIDTIAKAYAEPKTGHWIFIEENKYGIKVKCSECGAEVYYAGEKCPRCESKMEVSE